MRKWIWLLALALLFNVLQANAEETFYTNNDDRYYHTDPDCDRPAETNWWDEFDAQPRELYEREIYKKYPVSEAAAAEFQKNPCPVCVKDFEPVYLGDAMPKWNFDVEPWRVSGMEQQDITDKNFHNEVWNTNSAFNAYYEEYAVRGSGEVKRKHDYPSCFAGLYMNVQGSVTYMVADPSDEILASFEKMFGSGAWIVPAKYGYNEMDAAKDRIFQELNDLCKAHPEWDAGPVGAGVSEVDNCVNIGIHGEDWQLAAAALDETAPIYVHFEKDEAITTDF